jgi:glycine cleavage system H lipoate-binding protein
MPCPFLKETEVKYCRSSTIRKLIPMAQAGRAEERCSSEGYASCPVFQQQPDAGEVAAFGSCPYLHESLMQYCGAASITKFVPYSESLLSRCGNDTHRYCELYLAMAHPAPPAETVDGIPMPSELRYSANHMWVDVTGDGIAHAGIDAFLSRVLGQVERISYVWQKGRHRPTAVVTVAGVDLEITFPFPLQLTNCNLYLRANPGRLTAEPYTGGWLFEGIADAGTMESLPRGDEAHDWMDADVRRMSEFLQHLLATGRTAGANAPGGTSGPTAAAGTVGPTAADGGVFSAGLAKHIDREQMLALFHEFFSPYASR